MKYHNVKVKIGKLVFDSKGEYERWQQLKILEKAKLIKDLKRQVKYELQPSFKYNDKTIRKIEYVADFEYYDNHLETVVVEDFKGYATDDYKLKKKMFMYKYPDVLFQEVKK